MITADDAKAAVQLTLPEGWTAYDTHQEQDLIYVRLRQDATPDEPLFDFPQCFVDVETGAITWANALSGATGPSPFDSEVSS
jgi:hypothetical protein